MSIDKKRKQEIFLIDFISFCSFMCPGYKKSPIRHFVPNRRLFHGAAVIIL